MSVPRSPASPGPLTDSNSVQPLSQPERQLIVFKGHYSLLPDLWIGVHMPHTRQDSNPPCLHVTEARQGHRDGNPGYDPL